MFPLGRVSTHQREYLVGRLPLEMHGNYNVTFTVTDDGTPAESDSEVVTISVGNVNRPPVLGAIGSKSVDEGDLTYRSPSVHAIPMATPLPTAPVIFRRERTLILVRGLSVGHLPSVMLETIMFSSRSPIVVHHLRVTWRSLPLRS